MSSEKKAGDQHFRRDLIKLLCLFLAVVGTSALFFVTPALSTPSLLAVAIAMLLSPLVASLERSGFPRALSITILFVAFGLVIGYGGFWLVQAGQDEWSSFREAAPKHFQSTIQWLRRTEATWHARYSFLKSVHPSDTFVEWGQNTGSWFVTHGPAIMGELLTCVLIVPFLCFVMLSDGRDIFRRFLALVPNRFFEPVLIVSTEIVDSLASYLRAKLLEAFLVAAMTTAGLAIVKAPYALVLGALAGVTNIIPYFGPVIGAIPGLLIAVFDPSSAEAGTLTLSPMVWKVLGVYTAVNVVDTVFIFPVVVAKLVNLHPLILIAVVMLGQEYYGLVGMLISIPIASALKVIIHEIYSAVYEQHATTRASERAPDPSTYDDFPGLRTG